MGVVDSFKAQHSTPTTSKRRSGQLDFSSLGPLKTTGTIGFSAFRDHDNDSARRRKARKKSNGDLGAAMVDDDDSDDEENTGTLLGKMEDDNDMKDGKSKSSPEDAQFSGELAEGLNRIRV